MRLHAWKAGLLAITATVPLPLRLDAPVSQAWSVAPEAMRFSKVTNGRAEVVTYRGKRAVHLVPDAPTAGQDLDMLALLDKGDFRNGTIEIDVAGIPGPYAAPDSRGFVGIGFRTTPDAARSEIFYLRPLNARVDDQLRRNHSVQYISRPEWTWQRLRQETPGVYESYADMDPGAWTTMRIVVHGTSAKLYVNGAAQPALVVNDLKRGDVAGSIALWAHIETDAYFGAMTVTPE